jgi:hypothetical protein
VLFAFAGDIGKGPAFEILRLLRCTRKYCGRRDLSLHGSREVIPLCEVHGWHTCRRTWSTLLQANREDMKVVQELLQHGLQR